MLKFYIATVIVYMIVLYCECKVFRNNIIKNGWVTESKTDISGLFALICYSAIPVFRFIIAITLFVMTIYTREVVQDWFKENNNAKSN